MSVTDPLRAEAATAHSVPPADESPRPRTGFSGWLHRMADSDLWWSFKNNPTAIGAFIMTVLMIGSALLAPVIAPQDPFNPAESNLLNSLVPPMWMPGGSADFIFGADDLGRDIFSLILYGAGISIAVGFASVVFAAIIGVVLGLVAGYAGGWIDNILMRIADIQLSFPAILIALLIDGMARGILPRDLHTDMALYVLIVAIGLSFWVQYARTVRGVVLVERTKEYVQAGQVIGLPNYLILFRHILPNVMSPVLVIATIQLALAIITEATLSFLGVGVPPTSPSLGTLIRIGNDNLFSGAWWITIFPGIALVMLVLAVNMLGDWLRDALNPKLR